MAPRTPVPVREATLRVAVALSRRRREPAPTSPGPDPESEGFPPWVMSSVVEFLGPFVRGEGQNVTDSHGYRKRNFLQEAERNLRIPLDWRQREHSAVESLFRRCEADPSLLVDLVDFALRNILLGTYFQNYEEVAGELDRALRESGAPWRVAPIDGNVNHRLERRVDPAAVAARARLARKEVLGSSHLAAAWESAYGRNPNPSRAYSEAVKAVEEVAVAAVLPNDATATLGRVIGTLRATSAQWDCVLGRESATANATLTPVEVVITMLDLLWGNQVDRHAPVEEVTQPQAETAVHLALALVEIFGSGAMSKR